jgi:hypothetical protein
VGDFKEMWKIMNWLNMKLRDRLFMDTVINVVPLGVGGGGRNP